MNIKNVLRKAGYLGLSAYFALAVQSCTDVAGCNDASALNYVADSDGTIQCFYETTDVDTGVETVVVSENISVDTEWASDKVYQLGGRITVLDGATLTIQPGTIIKGEAGTGANATALLIARGGKLMAEGTADAPIIFTSVADEIMPEDITNGLFVSPNLASDVNGLWGGVIVCGKAPISASNDAGTDVAEIQIEGIPTSDQNGLYGGTVADDNSGVLSYISVRHGGTNIGSGNEINGISFGGVGTGTNVSNIEIVGNQDDGIEWYGGTVECTNILTWNVGDDGLDTDMSWDGTLDNFIIITAAGHAFELDGPEGTMEASHDFTNGTVVASNDNVQTKDLINTDDNSMVHIENLFITSIVEGQVIDTDGQGAGVSFTNVLLDLPTGTVVTDFTKGGADVTGVSAGTTSQATASAFAWTWAAQTGETAGL